MEKLAHRRYALEQRYPRWEPMTIAQRFDAAAAAYPDRPHVITDSHAYTYAEMQAWSRRLACGLLAIGIQPGEHVAMLMTNSPEFIALKYAIARIGAVAAPFNYLYRTEELGYVIQQSDCVALITMQAWRDVDFLEALDTLAPGWEQRGGGSAFPCLRRVITLAPYRDGVLSLQDLEALGEHVAEADLQKREQAAQPDAVSDIIYTSGTTGHPHSAMLTHEMVLRCAYGSVLTQALDDGWRMLFALPLYHVFAYVEGLLTTLFVGGAVIPQASFNPTATLEAVARHRANELLVVPTMTIAVVEQAARARYELSSLEAVFSAAAPAPVWLWERVLRELGVVQVFTAYGQTEASASTTFTLPGDPLEVVSSTVGKPKLGGVAGIPELGGQLVEYKTIDPFTGADLPPGEEGELAVRGLIVMRGYYGKPQETAAVLDAHGWMRSGDLGRIRADGYIELTGRSKELYKCGGETVAPKEVEQVLTRHPAVSQAYVVGLPDERLGEVGCAWIVPAEGQHVEPKEIIAYCRQHLARFKVPRHVFLLAAADLPATATGKVQKFRLADQAMAELGIIAPAQS
jgi:fatty-acyl-CoA synthase